MYPQSMLEDIITEICQYGKLVEQKAQMIRQKQRNLRQIEAEQAQLQKKLTNLLHDNQPIKHTIIQMEIQNNQLYQKKVAMLQQIAQQQIYLAGQDKVLIQLESRAREEEQQVKQLLIRRQKQLKKLHEISKNQKMIQNLRCRQHFNEKAVQLNEQVQQLKGNIRVYCRIRSSRSQKRINYKVENDQITIVRNQNLQNKSANFQKQLVLTFDHIFSETCGQTQVFNEMSSLIQSGINGKNLCVFSYGQTGSGKTYTIQGGISQETRGLIPRSLQLLFDQQGEKKISISICQIYNEKIKDLLEQSRIVERPNMRRFHQVHSKQESLHLFQKCSLIRSTSSTKCNTNSSRSHLVFTVKIECRERQNFIAVIDLAGSQRVNESQVTGDRLKQAMHINRSLTELGSIISRLKEAKHRPNFRNSKLGMILQLYLQGLKGAKVVMIVNVSSDLSDEDQTVNSLKFANRARECVPRI